MKDQKQQKSHVMDATGKGDFDTSGRGSFLGTLDNSAGAAATKRNMTLAPGVGGVEDPRAEGMAKQQSKTVVQPVTEHLQTLFSGQDLSEEFMNKASVVFEAALNERTSVIREELLQESATLLEQEVSKTVNELATRLDEYLNYVVEEWMQENKLAVESGIRTEIAESFITGLKTLFETHYVEVPESKHDVLEDLFAENQKLEESLNEQIKNNMDMKQEIVAGQARSVFLETISDMSKVDAERLASLAESVEFTSVEDFSNKLTILKENYMKAAPTAANEPEIIAEQKDQTQTSEGPMSAYVTAVSRQVKKF